jgi:TrmH family RNA methyltransferase
MITSPQNPRIVAAAKLHRSRRRAETGSTLLEGPHLVAEALASGAEVTVIYTTDADQVAPWHEVVGDTEVVEVTPQILAKLAGTEHPRGPVAVLQIPTSLTPARRDTVAMVGLADPGNAGTIIRSAGAFDFQIGVGPNTVDPWAPKVLRSGAGGHFRVPLIELGDDPVGALEDTGCRIVALTVADGVPIDTLPSDAPVAFLVGSEPQGLPAVVVARSEFAVTLPMPGGAESLNVAVAASIAMYERRRLVPRPPLR